LYNLKDVLQFLDCIILKLCQIKKSWKKK